MEEAIAMSRKEIDRLEVIQATANRQLYQSDAARQLGLSVRQIKRLVAGYRREGARALVSRRRGQRAKNAIAEEVRETILEYPTYAVCGLWAHPIPREAGGMSSVQPLGGDLAPMDDSRWVMGRQTAQAGAHSPAPPTPSLSWRAGTDRRLTTRLVRRPETQMHADRVYR